MKQIAVIDDDVYIGDMLAEVLAREGYGVMRAYSGTEALMLLSARKPDLVLLDLMLPGLTGEEVLKRIPGIPVIVVSAKADVKDRVNLLMEGAADYITKPFQIPELLARIAVQLRAPRAAGEPQTLSFAGIELDAAKREAHVDGVPVRLTKTEFAILKLLMENPLQVIPKSTILDRISRDTPDCVESSLKVHVSNLRRKVRAVNGRDFIEAVWGIGFRLKTE